MNLRYLFTHTHIEDDWYDRWIYYTGKKKKTVSIFVSVTNWSFWSENGRVGLIMFISQAGSIGDKQLRINDKNVCLCFQLTVPQFSGRCSYHDKYYPLQLWRNFNLSIHPSTVFIKGQAEILNVCSEIASVFMSQTTEIESLQDFSCMHSISEKNQQCESNDHPRPFMLVTGRHLGKKVLRSDDGTTKVVFVFELL